MDSDLTTQLTMTRAAVGAGSIQNAVLKKAAEADAAIVTMVTEAVRSAPPPPGQGLRVDKQA